MDVLIDVSKTVEENAAEYYEKSKKCKKKLEGLRKAYKNTLAKIESLKAKEEIFKEKERAVVEKRKREWYEKFRWFFSSEGLLCIGGRDATTNDIIIKKYTEEGDVVFHTQLPGSPFFVVKAAGKVVGEATIREAAQATASYSRAWRHGLTTAEVYYIKPDQVKKELGLPKGTFMIHGKRTYLNPVVRLAVGVSKDGRIIGGPVDAVKANAEKFVAISQGTLKSSDVAKAIQRQLGGSLEDIQAFLPPGNSGLAKA